MTLIEHYFTYLQELADGTRTAPDGMELHETEPMPRAAELQTQIQAMGVPEFVRRCAAQDGLTLPEEVYAAYRDEDLRAALSAMVEDASPAPDENDPAAPPQIDEPDGPRSAYEVLLDCCCLDENLLFYLIDVLFYHILIQKRIDNLKIKKYKFFWQGIARSPKNVYNIERRI